MRVVLYKVTKVCVHIRTFIIGSLIAVQGSLAATHGLDDTVLSAAELDAGMKLYARCKACHAFEYNRIGPKHCGLKGRKAGGLDDYRFSKAMKQSDIVWNADSLNRFLKSPTTVIPGTTMGYAGVKDGVERRVLVAYLLQESVSPERCPDE